MWLEVFNRLRDPRKPINLYDVAANAGVTIVDLADLVEDSHKIRETIIVTLLEHEAFHCGHASVSVPHNLALQLLLSIKNFVKVSRMNVYYVTQMLRRREIADMTSTFKNATGRIFRLDNFIVIFE